MKIYFMVDSRMVNGIPQLEIDAATPENGPSGFLGEFSSPRSPFWQTSGMTLSPDGKWIAILLTDGFSNNIWALSTSTGGEPRQITDFGGRPTFIARAVSWSSDSRSGFAAVAEADAIIYLLHGLLTGRRE